MAFAICDAAKEEKLKITRHSPDGHDKDQHDDGDLHHPVATDASAVVKVTGTLVVAVTRAATALVSPVMRTVVATVLTVVMDAVVAARTVRATTICPPLPVV